MDFTSTVLFLCGILFPPLIFILSRQTGDEAGQEPLLFAASYNHLKRSNLSERAVSNQRLVRAFGIENPFTTTDKAYHRRFLRDIQPQISVTNIEWQFISEMAGLYIDAACREIQPHVRYPLVQFVQIFVLCMVMKHFFPRLAKLPTDEAAFVTRKINSLWMSSKRQTESQMAEEKADLFQALRRIFRLPEVEGRENPLNIILPAYETLWRVVLRCFLSMHAGREHMFDVADFLEQPSAELFQQVPLGYDFSLADIVSETLRLYPPTRRIYRHGHPAVDVEALQRDPSIWGPDPLTFRPRRWEGEIGEAQEQAFMPFGMGRFQCPARKSFAPMMIGILAARLYRDLDVLRVVVHDRGGGVDKVLDNSRDGLGEYSLVVTRMPRPYRRPSDRDDSFSQGSSS